MEEYKLIDGYENYEVSSFGNVRNVSKTGRVLKPGHDKDGYLRVNLSKDGKCKDNKIHRLMAMTFIDNIENKRCVDHIDNDKTNNVIGSK
jgi:hypothetical protein